jgi:hypothetical protein
MRWQGVATWTVRVSLCGETISALTLRSPLLKKILSFGLSSWIERTGLDRIPFLEKATLYAFNWLHRHDPPLAPLSAGLVSLTGVYKLFLEPSDNPVLAHSTHEMYLRAPEPKQDVVLGEGNYAGMPDDAKRVYENRIMSFLLVNLPPTSQ